MIPEAECPLPDTEMKEMIMEYHVKKNKLTRISYRTVGIMFILVAIAALIAADHMTSGGRVFMILFALVLIWYGAYLFKMSFRRQAYDITFKFEEAGITIYHHRGEEQVPYAGVEDVQIIAPDPDLSYRIVRIKIGKIQYVLPFPNDIELSERVFQYVYSRLENVGKKQEKE